MKKIINILFVLAVLSSFFGLKEAAFAAPAGKMLVSPVNVPTAQSSYGAYPDVTGMVANDIINSINKYSSFDVPDINSANDLIQSYGLSKYYKEFLMNYRDNRVVDYKTCNALGNRLGVGKILLVSGGFDIQNMFLHKSYTDKINKQFMPVPKYSSIPLFLFTNLPFTVNKIFDFFKDESPITPFYQANIQLALIDTDTGLVVWEKAYNQNLPASDFGNPASSFGESTISTGKLRNFSEKIARETSFEVYMATKNSDYTSVKSSIVSSSEKTTGGTVKTVDKNTKITPRDGKMTKDGHPSSFNDKDLENKRKQSYKNWVKERAKN